MASEPEHIAAERVGFVSRDRPVVSVVGQHRPARRGWAQRPEGPGRSDRRGLATTIGGAGRGRPEEARHRARGPPPRRRPATAPPRLGSSREGADEGEISVARDAADVDRRRRPGPVESSLGPRMAGIILETRRRLGWTQRMLEERAGVSRTQIYRIERRRSGHGRVDEVARLLDALGVRLEIGVSPPVSIGAPAQRDAAHARVVNYTARHLQRAGIAVAHEVPISADRVRGWIDILGSDARRDVLFVVECKSDLHDVGALERQVAWYEREAPWAAHRLGWAARRKAVLIVTMLPTSRNTETIRANRSVLKERFPFPVTALRSLLDGSTAPPGPLRALAFVDPGRRGPGWLLPTPLGPGRPVVRYEDARAFLEGRRRS